MRADRARAPAVAEPSAASQPLLEPSEASAAIADCVRLLPPVTVPLASAIGRVLTAPVGAVTDLPPFDRSAMDGFAVRAGESGGELLIVGDAAAGGPAPPPLASGTAVRISTGAPLPAGADAVLRSELAAVDGSVLRALEPVPERRFVRFRAEDVRAGDVLAAAGTALSTQRAIALASAGISEVSVHERPAVRLLITGDELQAPGTRPLTGAVFECNGLGLRHLAERAGATVVGTDIIGDDAAAVRAAVSQGLSADVLIVSGGMSVGPHDHVKSAFLACGVTEIFWRVAIKPGKPVWFGRSSKSLVFGLPGNPLSSLVCFLVFIEPALRMLQGHRGVGTGRPLGRLGAPAGPEDDRTTLLTARFQRGPDGVLVATPTGRQGSHMTGALGESDGFIIVPREAGPLPAGTPVELLTIDPVPGLLP